MNRTGPSSLRILPAYTAIESMAEAFTDPRASRLLWLELLVNDQIDPALWRDRPAFQQAYEKACRWHTTYRSVIGAVLAREPLPAASGPVDLREHRTFIEAIRFASTHG